MSRGKEGASGSCWLRESMTTYEAVFDPENSLLREKITFLWETYIEKLLSWLGPTSIGVLTYTLFGRHCQHKYWSESRLHLQMRNWCEFSRVKICG